MNFIPDRHYKKISDIDFKDLYQQGVRGLLFDIDNTLVKDEAPVNEASIKLFEKLCNIGFKCAIVSNNDEKRVKNFAKPCSIEYVYNVLKPKNSGYIKAMKLIGTTKDNTIMIGDQLVTDILGANNANIKSFLVDPIDRRNERFHIKLKRLFECVVVFFNRKKFRYYQNRQ